MANEIVSFSFFSRLRRKSFSSPLVRHWVKYLVCFKCTQTTWYNFDLGLWQVFFIVTLYAVNNLLTRVWQHTVMTAEDIQYVTVSVLHHNDLTMMCFCKYVHLLGYLMKWNVVFCSFSSLIQTGRYLTSPTWIECLTKNNHTLRLSIQNVVERSTAPHRRALQTNYECLLLFISQRIGEIDWNWEA